MSIDDTATSTLSGNPAKETPWNPRKLAPDEAICRENLLQNLPGGSTRLELPKLTQVLSVGYARIEIFEICRETPNRNSPHSVYLALVGPQGGRAVLALERNLARDLVDEILARPSSSAIRNLTSGEEGALFFAIDRAGGDWLHAGGAAFTLKGLLTNRIQAEEYLTAPAVWSVGARFSSDRLTGELRLLLAFAPSGIISTEPTAPLSLEVSGTLPVNFRLRIDHVRLNNGSVRDLGEGDLIFTNKCGFPYGRAKDVPVVLRCGSFTRYARWLDRTALELIEHDWEKKMTGTNRTEIDANFEAATEKDGAGLELDVQIELGRVTMRVDRAVNLIPGAVVRLNKPVGTDVILRAGEKIIAKGELVDQDGRLAVEITEVP